MVFNISKPTAEEWRIFYRMRDWEDTPQSFDRFERLVKGLMTVPKKDLDKEIAKDQRKKGRSGPQRNTALQHRLAPKLEVIDNTVIRLLAC